MLSSSQLSLRLSGLFRRVFFCPLLFFRGNVFCGRREALKRVFDVVVRGLPDLVRVQQVWIQGHPHELFYPSDEGKGFELREVQVGVKISCDFRPRRACAWQQQQCRPQISNTAILGSYRYPLYIELLQQGTAYPISYLRPSPILVPKGGAASNKVRFV